MTTTREMLEDAARAAGIELQGESPHGGHWAWHEQRQQYETWNPPENCGDALQLAGTLSIDILYRFVGGMRVECIAPGGPTISVPCESHADMSATCLAVTRAGAAIGKRMKEGKE
ncbi:MAG: hypothetical protein V4757_07020 [Pseudomonadota bacterium]